MSDEGGKKTKCDEHLQFDLMLDEPILEKVTDTAPPEARWIIAKDPITPPGILKELALDKDDGVKANVAANENAPKDALEQLAKSEEWVTRSNVAANPSAPPEALKRLATDPIWPVRRNVAANPKVEVSILHLLAEDADERPRLEAVRRLTALEAKPIPQVITAKPRFNMTVPVLAARRLASLIDLGGALKHHRPRRKLRLKKGRKTPRRGAKKLGRRKPKPS
jgi:hypothetical protein